MDSCASDNVMPRKTLEDLGYQIKASPGSKRGQKWGSASGHAIINEGQVEYRFMTEAGRVAKGTAAVSKIIAAGNFAFFSSEENCLIDSRDQLAQKVLKMIQQIKKRTTIYEHKGTYRMRAWMMPAGQGSGAPFGRQGP